MQTSCKEDSQGKVTDEGVEMDTKRAREVDQTVHLPTADDAAPKAATDDVLLDIAITGVLQGIEEIMGVG